MEEDSIESDGEVYIIGTSHVSDDSYEKVKELAERVNPDGVAVELDKTRYEKLIKTGGKIEDKSLREMLSDTKGLGLKSRLILIAITGIQSKVARAVGTDFTGRDMLAGHEVAKERDIPLALVDRDISDTLNRLSSALSVRDILVFVWALIALKLGLGRTDDEEAISDATNPENMNLEELEEEFERSFPEMKRVLFDERNEIISQKTEAFAQNNDRTILVIGALHERGVREILSDSEKVRVVDTEEQEVLEKNQ
jgi:pheromone shutdown protein TraB